MIDKNDFITLSDNNKYLVVSKVEYQNATYLYLADIVDNINIKFVLVYNDTVIAVNDNELLKKLFKLIVSDLKLDLT